MASLGAQASQLGTKRVINSFVVARTTMRKRVGVLPRCCMCKAASLMLLGPHDLPAHGCLQESASGNLSVEAEGLGGKALEELKVIQGACTASRCSTRITLPGNRLHIARTLLACRGQVFQASMHGQE